MAIWLTLAPALLNVLHGKSAPLGSSGALSGLPYGAGVLMIMWARTIVEAIVVAIRIAFKEGMMTNADLERYGKVATSTCELCVVCCVSCA